MGAEQSNFFLFREGDTSHGQVPEAGWLRHAAPREEEGVDGRPIVERLRIILQG